MELRLNRDGFPFGQRERATLFVHPLFNRLLGLAVDSQLIRDTVKEPPPSCRMPLEQFGVTRRQGLQILLQLVHPPLVISRARDLYRAAFGRMKAAREISLGTTPTLPRHIVSA